MASNNSDTWNYEMDLEDEDQPVAVIIFTYDFEFTEILTYCQHRNLDVKEAPYLFHYANQDYPKNCIEFMDIGDYFIAYHRCIERQMNCRAQTLNAPSLA